MQKTILHITIYDDFSGKTLSGYFVSQTQISAINEAKESWAVSLDCNSEDIQITETRVVSPEEYQAAIQKHFQFGNTQ